VLEISLKYLGLTSILGAITSRIQMQDALGSLEALDLVFNSNEMSNLFEFFQLYSLFLQQNINLNNV